MPQKPKTHRAPRVHAPPHVQPRPSASKRGYDRKWRAIRRRFLDAHPFCSCGAIATEVDHNVPLRAGGSNEWSNLRAMCGYCHRRKTAQHDGAFGRKRSTVTARGTHDDRDAFGAQER